MSIKYDVHMTHVGIGTSIVSTETRLFRKPRIEEFVCYKIGPIMGGEWLSRNSGKVAEPEINAKLNDVAQAYKSLAEMKELLK